MPRDDEAWERAEAAPWNETGDGEWQRVYAAWQETQAHYGEPPDEMREAAPDSDTEEEDVAGWVLCHECGCQTPYAGDALPGAVFACHNCRAPLDVPRHALPLGERVECPNCGGAGGYHDESPSAIHGAMVSCPACGGTGYMREVLTH